LIEKTGDAPETGGTGGSIVRQEDRDAAERRLVETDEVQGAATDAELKTWKEFFELSLYPEVQL